MEIMIALFVLAALVGGGVFLWRQTKAKGRWGLGAFGGTTCPRCAARLPMIRRPASAQEALWGGWTCRTCGCKVDKYGKERAAG